MNQETGELGLIGIVINSNNGCANSQGHNMIHPFTDWINDSVKYYRSLISI